MSSSLLLVPVAESRSTASTFFTSGALLEAAAGRNAGVPIGWHNEALFPTVSRWLCGSQMPSPSGPDAVGGILAGEWVTPSMGGTNFVQQARETKDDQAP
ncbi:hypothetical protein EJB05_44466, partial [Eragrostis curvula]